MKVITHETHYMKSMVLLWSTIYETHYMKNKVLLWSTSVEKEIVALPFLFSLSFLGLSFFLFGLSLFFWLGNALIMMIITLLLITTYELQLETRTRYDSIWMPPAVYRYGQWIKSDMYQKLCKVALPQIRCQLHDHAKSNMTMMEHVIINGTVESCMAIYLGMAMEMP